MTERFAMSHGTMAGMDAADISGFIVEYTDIDEDDDSIEACRWMFEIHEISDQAVAIVTDFDRASAVGLDEESTGAILVWLDQAITGGTVQPAVIDAVSGPRALFTAPDGWIYCREITDPHAGFPVAAPARNDDTTLAVRPDSWATFREFLLLVQSRLQARRIGPVA